MKKTLYFLLFFPYLAFSQPYLAKDGKTRHRFAQTVFGLDAQVSYGGKSAFINSAGETETFALSPQVSPRFYISGTHFWGHTEFYLAFRLLYRPVSYKDISYLTNQSDIFGIKIYPWPIQKKRLRPYAGFTFSNLSYQQGKSAPALNGPEVNRLRVPLIAGATYCSGKYLFDLGLNYSYDNKLSYYISPQKSIGVSTPPVTVRFGIRKWLETTLSAEKPYLDGSTEKSYSELKKRHLLNSWFVGLGPSSTFYLKDSPYNSLLFPFMDKSFASVFPEISAGYHHEASKIHLGLAFRRIRENLLAYGHRQQFKRNSLSLEAFRYLFDYHGFNPYAGACLSYEQLGFTHTSDSLNVKSNKTLFAPGIIFGWDILPDKLQWIVLRTSLRYFPNLKLEPVKSKSVFMDQLEFNFIQVVFYPQRLKSLRSL